MNMSRLLCPDPDIASASYQLENRSISALGQQRYSQQYYVRFTLKADIADDSVRHK
jgi:hypothetical protein